jgi:glycosyltransferase involved in cell wall biosynthesis
MYSGNHSPCHPLDALLEAARQLAADSRIHFMFIGGGSEFKKVQEFRKLHHLDNIDCLPYQPMEILASSLSAADLHMVVMGNPFVGMVHPCKIYNILALGLPFVGIGPEECHLTDLAGRVSDRRYARICRNGDVASIVAAVSDAAEVGSLPPSGDLRALSREFSQSALLPKFISVLESRCRGGVA